MKKKYYTFFNKEMLLKNAIRNSLYDTIKKYSQDIYNLDIVVNFLKEYDNYAYSDIFIIDAIEELIVTIISEHEKNIKKIEKLMEVGLNPYLKEKIKGYITKPKQNTKEIKIYEETEQSNWFLIIFYDEENFREFIECYPRITFDRILYDLEDVVYEELEMDITKHIKFLEYYFKDVYIIIISPKK